MSESMILQSARALMVSMQESDCETFCRYLPCPCAEKAIRAVFAAAREPTEAMTDRIDLWNAKEIWQAMVDVILAEKP